MTEEKSDVHEHDDLDDDLDDDLEVTAADMVQRAREDTR